MNYESWLERESQATPGVTFVLAKMSFGRRVELMRRLREIAQKVEFHEAGDASEEDHPRGVRHLADQDVTVADLVEFLDGPHDAGDPFDHARRGAEPPRRVSGETEGAGDAADSDQDRSGKPPVRDCLVQHEMRRPLLVDPVTPECPDRQSVDVRKSVLGDQAAVDEREPAVLVEEDRHRESEDDRPEGKDGDREPVTLEPASQPLGAPRARRLERPLPDQGPDRHTSLVGRKVGLLDSERDSRSERPAGQPS